MSVSWMSCWMLLANQSSGSQVSSATQHFFETQGSAGCSRGNSLFQQSFFSNIESEMYFYGTVYDKLIWIYVREEGSWGHLNPVLLAAWRSRGTVWVVLSGPVVFLVEPHTKHSFLLGGLCIAPPSMAFQRVWTLTPGAHARLRRR